MLKHLYPFKTFVAEVYASDTGIGMREGKICVGVVNGEAKVLSMPSAHDFV